MNRRPLRLVVSNSEKSEQPPHQADSADQIYIEALYRKYRDQVLRYLERRLANKDDAQELLQETYIKLLRRGCADNLDRNPKGYLFAIARNLIIDKIRAGQIYNSAEHKDITDVELGSELESPQQITEWSSALEQLKQALLELPPRARQVFVLHRFNNLNYPEIAETLGVTTRTVERDMSTAMAFCAQRLTEFL